MKNVVALAGGVGGAKLVLGLAHNLPTENLTVIVNTGDDFTHLGLRICPDVDTICYTLAGLSNQTSGWGRKDDTWNCLKSLIKLDSLSWFQIGDKDLALHLERTRLLALGQDLTQVTQTLCEKLDVKTIVYPMTNEKVSTIIETDEYGDLPFQEYFVKHQFKPKLRNYKFEGIKNAKLTNETKKALNQADIVVICPSNPWLSIMPILEVENCKEILSKKTTIAVSPIVGNSAIKGPAAKIFFELGIVPSAFEVARIYKEIIKGYVLDTKNQNECDTISSWGIIPFVTDTIMSNESSKKRLAADVFRFAVKILEESTT
ncbi:MAG: 2-phospho-L-lactate transferase [Chlorobiaceae bacterium]|nr:2-phospho-L-lactate transferase [Chlorobiaceae bacterium]